MVPNLNDNRDVKFLYALLSLSVVFYHSGTDDLSLLPAGEWLNNLLTSIRMPLYFFLGGFLLFKTSLHKGFDYILKRRFQKLLLPFIWFTPTYFILESTFTETSFRRPDSILSSIFFPGYHLWFLPAFFLATLIGFIQIRFSKHVTMHLIYFSISILVSFLISSNEDGFLAFFSTIELFPYLSFGIIFGHLIATTSQSGIKIFSFCTLILAFFNLILVYPGISTSCILLLFPYIFYMSNKVQIRGIFNFLSDYTFQIYLFSPAGIGLSRLIMNQIEIPNSLTKILISALIGLLVTAVITLIAKRFKILSKLVGL